jgi:hypothetical protein
MSPFYIAALETNAINLVSTPTNLRFAGDPSAAAADVPLVVRKLYYHLTYLQRIPLVVLLLYPNLGWA